MVMRSSVKWIQFGDDGCRGSRIQQVVNELRGERFRRDPLVCRSRPKINALPILRERYEMVRLVDPEGHHTRTCWCP